MSQVAAGSSATGDQFAGAASDYSKIPAWVDGALQPVDKLFVHQQGLRHKAVSVFVVRGREVLIQRRALTKYHTPGLWANTCCTHPLWGESSADCAVRRLNEELGITGLAPEIRHALEYRAEVGGGLTEHEMVDVFVAEWQASATLAPIPAEVAETAWITVDDLVKDTLSSPERYTPWICIYMAEHRARIFDDG